MRNLLEYPLTSEEAYQAIDRSIEKYKGQIGSIEPYALHVIKAFIEKNKDEFESYVVSKKIHT